MALFKQTAAKIVVPEALSEAYEAVEIRDLLEEARSLHNLISASPR